MLFPEACERYGGLVYETRTLRVTGRIEPGGQINCEKMEVARRSPKETLENRESIEMGNLLGDPIASPRLIDYLTYRIRMLLEQQTLKPTLIDMGKQIIAEGVETKAEQETLVALGCDLLQGYFFARPSAFPLRDSG